MSGGPVKVFDALTSCHRATHVLRDLRAVYQSRYHNFGLNSKIQS